MKPESIRQPFQLVVEGRDAFNFFGAFVENLKLADVQVQNFGGVTDLNEFLDAFVKAPRFAEVRSIGIVRDAERRAGDERPREAQPSPCFERLPECAVVLTAARAAGAGSTD